MNVVRAFQRFYGSDNGEDELHPALSAAVDWQGQSFTVQLPPTVSLLTCISLRGDFVVVS